MEFFEILRRQVRVSGLTKMIDDLIQAHWHPATGLPTKNLNSGCAPVIFLCIRIGGLGA